MRDIPQTPQAYYDLLVKTSEEGGFPAAEGNSCLYRTSDGRACAVGLLMDDKTAESAPQCQVLNLPRSILDKLPDWAPLSPLRDIQRAHDDLAWEREWEHDKFVRRINGNPIFDNVQRVPA
jgi:hypothetical protein